MGVQVDDQRPDDDLPLVLFGEIVQASAVRLDAGDQFPDAERLDDVVVGAELQTDDAVHLGVFGREKQDRHVGSVAGRVCAQRPADLEAVLFRHEDVKDDEIPAARASPAARRRRHRRPR